MITYENFKKVIEREKFVDEAIYNDLVMNNSVTLINNHFERYLNDSTVNDDQNKFNRTSYYIALSETNVDDEQLDMGDLQNVDLLRAYLSDISCIKLLTEEEELLYCKKIKRLNNELLKRDITVENINDRLAKFGYNFGEHTDNTLRNLEDRMFYVSKFIDKINVSNGNDVNSLIVQVN